MADGMFALIPEGEYQAKATTIKKMSADAGWSIAYTIEVGTYAGRQVFGHVQSFDDMDGDVVGRSFNIQVTHSERMDARTGTMKVFPKAQALSRIGGPAGQM